MINHLEEPELRRTKRRLETVSLPLLPLRGLAVFPNTVLTIDVARERSLAGLQRAITGDMDLFVVAQRDSLVDHPAMEDLYTVGTIVHIKQVMNMPDQSIRVLVEGRSRGILLEVKEEADSQTAEVCALMAEPGSVLTADEKELMRAIRSFAPQAARSRGISASSQ